MNDIGRKTLKKYLEQLLEDEKCTLVLAKVLYEKGLWIVPCPLSDWIKTCPEKESSMLYYICNNIGQPEQYFRDKLFITEPQELEDVENIPMTILPITLESKKQGLNEFIKNCKESEEATTSSDFYSYYRDWCKKMGHDAYAQAAFIRQLRNINGSREVYTNTRSFGWLWTPPE